MLKSYLHKGVVEAGCDEAGRGCLAGAVYAAAVILPPDFKDERLNDSKQLTEKQRYALREVIERTGTVHKPCVVCSRLRRGHLYALAKRLSCSKLALGHHLDDILVSFLISCCRGGGLTTMGPNVPSDDGMIRVIRPFAYVEEKTTIRAAAMLQIPPRGECVYKQQLEESGDRAYFKRLLHRMELRVPGLLQNMRRSLSDLRPEYLLDPRFLPPESVSAAVTPRSPSSEEPCSPRKQNDNR